MANKVEICGVNTAKLPVYKDYEMQEMLLAIKAGDMEVRDKFITGNLRLVLSVIQRFTGRGENPGRPVPGGMYRIDQGSRQF